MWIEENKVIETSNIINEIKLSIKKKPNIDLILIQQSFENAVFIAIASSIINVNNTISQTHLNKIP